MLRITLAPIKARLTLATSLYLMADLNDHSMIIFTYRMALCHAVNDC